MIFNQKVFIQKCVMTFLTKTVAIESIHECLVEDVERFSVQSSAKNENFELYIKCLQKNIYMC